MVFSNAVVVISTDKFSNFLILQSSAHDIWVQEFGSKLKTDLRYTVSDCFETFPFPQNLAAETENELEQIGDTYHEFRRQLMLKMQLGLTKTYNQFHNPQLSSEIDNTTLTNRKELEKKFGKQTVNLWSHLNKSDNLCSLDQAITDIKHLRQLHKEMDEAVLKAYGWDDHDLAHDFYEVDYLPENDRVRYTISPEARKEVLKRLLLLNHEIYAEEVKQGLHGTKKSQAVTLKKKTVQENTNQMTVFDNPVVKPERLTQKLNPIPASGSGNNFKVGDQVVHEQFGQGVVKSVIGQGENAKLTIKFDHYGVKTMVAKYVGLENS